jgi:hypothetical protein
LTPGLFPFSPDRVRIRFETGFLFSPSIL